MVLYNPTVRPSDLETILGLPRFSSDTSLHPTVIQINV